MPASYTITSTRDQAMSFSGETDSLSVTWNRDYFVEVSGVDPSTVDAYDVITASGLPIVNRSVYTIGSRIIPFVICRDKTAKQIDKRLSRWQVSTKWKASIKTNSEESDNQPIDPPDALTDITPRVVPELGEVERVLYIDKSSTPKAILTPLKRFYAEPGIERIPTLTLKITQYETSITYEQMLARKLKVNSATYRGEPRYKWLIENVEATEVEVLLSGGLTTAALVTYTVAHNPDTYGWKDNRALIDTHYIDGGVVLPFMDGGLRSQNYGFIQSDGSKKVGTLPDYEQFETYDDINFATFLQV